MNNRALTLLYDIKYFSKVAAKQIQDKNLSDYKKDEALRLGAERCLSKIGTALIALGELDAALLGNITGHRSVIETRNILASQYLDIDNEQVWRALVQDLPPLRDEAERLMA